MSSFKKSAPSHSAQPGSNRRNGVKPWINGLQLVSSGNNDLDDVLGGGVVLGSMSLLYEDDHSNYAETLVMYSIAESVFRGHKCLIISSDDKILGDDLYGKLPMNINPYSSLAEGKIIFRQIKTQTNEQKNQYMYKSYISEF